VFDKGFSDEGFSDKGFKGRRGLRAGA